MRVGHHCIIVMLRLFESKIESYSRGVPELRLCMAAPRHTQRNMRSIL